MTSMVLGALTTVVFMFKDGIDANTPIYYSLTVGLIRYVAVSLLSRQPVIVARST